MMENPPATPRPEYFLPPNVVLLELPDGTGQMLDFSGKFYALSETAVVMLRETLQRGTTSATRTVAAEYRMEPVEVRPDHLPIPVARPGPGVLADRGPLIVVPAEELGDLGLQRRLHQQLRAEPGHILQDLRQRTILSE
jgi:hypothetical protein